ncbi:hypothetical protein DAPPUDRAFT_326724 [Daphnia pulex]|uniref:Granulins domain-containing protein n=1 Tax=Daphnia pulex TaxID=6669 RepID=E9H8L0_DAPPU|nr:hypothetical protein DAPPUDRAFT_326724 [Daphnia pulex]|eukprot:EFX71925.1 hypothetical protein DAPPUDRAFT_326724 [Daphnia pulex]
MQKSLLFVIFSMALVFAWVEAVTERSNQTHPLIMGPHCHIQPGVDQSNCYWKGSSPFCVSGDACPYGFSLICKHACGDGKCCWTGNKSLCCPIPGESI